MSVRIDLLERPTQFYESLAGTHGPVARFRIGPVRLFIVQDAYLAAEIARRDGTGVGTPPMTRATLLQLGGNHILSTVGSQWAWRRKALQSYFAQLHRSDIDTQVATLVERALDEWPQAGVVTTSDRIDPVVMRVAILALFGISELRDEKVVDEALLSLDAMLAWLHKRFRHPLTTMPLVPTAANRRMWAARRSHRKVLTTLLEASSRDRPERFGLRRFVAGLGEGEARVLSDDRLLKHELSGLLSAGVVTTAPVAGWMLLEVGRRPELQEQLHELLDNDVAGFDRLATSVIRETLRLYPPVFESARAVRKPFVLGGQRLRRGDMVMVPVTTLHRSPEFWSRPGEFWPERFLADNEPRHPSAFVPFHSGPRACLGRRLAELELSAILRAVVRRWRWSSLNDPGSNTEFTLRPEPAVQIKLTARSADRPAALSGLLT